MSKLDELIQELCPDGVEYKPVGDIFDISRGIVISKEDILCNLGEYPVYSSQTENNGELGRIDRYTYEGEYLTWTTDGANAGTVFYRTGKFNVTNVCGLLKADRENIIARFAYHTLKVEAPKYVRRGMGNPKLMSNVMALIKIPIPPLQVQEEIVRILDNFTELTAELTARKKQYSYYRDDLLTFSNGTKCKQLGALAKIKNGKDYKSFGKGDVPVYGSGGIMTYVDTSAYNLPSVLIPRKGSLGNLFYVDEPFWTVDTIFYTEIDTDLIKPKYLFYYLQTQHLEKLNTAGGVPSLTQAVLNKIKIHIPPLEEQQRIVDILDRFDTLCNDISSGLPAEIKMRQQQYEHYRDKLLSFKKLEA